MLKDDHKNVARLFRRYEKAGDRAFVEKREVVDRIIEELSVHAAIEEQLFYPVARATVPGTEDIALESLEEHHIVKWVLAELEDLDVEDERFNAKVTVLIENVRHHVEEEETELFPLVRDELGRNALRDLGDAMDEARKVAPTHPHPRSPDEPPENLVAGGVAGVADRFTDTVSGLAQGGVTALGDVIATVMHRKRPRVSPTGTVRARKTARRVRGGAADAVESVQKRAQRAKAGTEEAVAAAERTSRSAAAGTKATAKAAKAGAKGTATSARKGAEQAATTAKRGGTTTARTAAASTRKTASKAKSGSGKTNSTAKGSRRAA